MFCSRHGLPDSIATYGLVSGLWTSTFALGAFVGPSVSGLLYDSIGFRHAVIFIIVLHAIVALVGLITIMCERTPQPYKELNSNDSLLRSHDSLFFNDKPWVFLAFCLIFRMTNSLAKYNNRTRITLNNFNGSSISIEQPRPCGVNSLMVCNSYNHKQCQTWSRWVFTA